MKLNRFEMAAVKRTAQNTKTLVRNKAKLEEKMKDLASQIVAINSQINMWEKPIVDKWGFNSAQLIEMDGELPEAQVGEGEPFAGPVIERSGDVEEIPAVKASAEIDDVKNMPFTL